MGPSLPDQITCQSSGNDRIQPRSVDTGLVRRNTKFLHDDRLVVLLLHGDVVLDPLITP